MKESTFAKKRLRSRSIARGGMCRKFKKNKNSKETMDKGKALWKMVSLSYKKFDVKKKRKDVKSWKDKLPKEKSPKEKLVKEKLARKNLLKEKLAEEKLAKAMKVMAKTMEM